MATIFLKSESVIKENDSQGLPVIPDRWNAWIKVENHHVSAPDSSVKPSIVYCCCGDWDARPRDCPINHLEVYDADSRLYWCLELIDDDNTLERAINYIALSDAHRGSLAVCKVFTVHWQGGTNHTYFGFVSNRRPWFDYLKLDPWRQLTERDAWEASWASHFKDWKVQIDNIADILDAKKLDIDFSRDQLRVHEHAQKLVIEFGKSHPTSTPLLIYSSTACERPGESYTCKTPAEIWLS